jgi:hypothetical protein
MVAAHDADLEQQLAALLAADTRCLQNATELSRSEKSAIRLSRRPRSLVGRGAARLGFLVHNVVTLPVVAVRAFRATG